MRRIILNTPTKSYDLTPLITGKINSITYTKTIKRLSKILKYCYLNKTNGTYYFILHRQYFHLTDFFHIYNNNLMMAIDMVWKKLAENGLLNKEE